MNANPRVAGLYILEGGRAVPAADYRTWSRWFETAFEARVVARAEPLPGVLVSTVFLSVDHAPPGHPPLIYETMVFRDGDGCEMWRYSTRAQAEAGHALAVEWVLEHAKDDP